MRFRLVLVVVVIAAVAYYAYSNYKPVIPNVPGPAAIINSVRNQVAPFRFNLETDPAQPSNAERIRLKVHVLDSAGNPATGVSVEADLSMAGMDHGAQHVVFRDEGEGDYEADVSLDMGGSWDVDLQATQGDKKARQRLTLDVSGS